MLQDGIHELKWKRDPCEQAKSRFSANTTRQPDCQMVPLLVPFLILTSDFTLSIPWVFTNKDPLN